MFSRTTKLMLRNVIQHTGTHNRMVEESEMWSQFEAAKEREEKSSQKSFLFDQRSDHYDDRRGRRQRTAHMDSDSDEHTKQEKSTYWARQLQKAEEKDPDRWGHSGFKELYPEDFDSDHSDRKDRGTSKKKKKRKKDRKHKKKKKKKEKKSKHHDSESDSGSDNEKHRKSFRRKCGSVENSSDRQRNDFHDSTVRKRKWSSSLSDSESSDDHQRHRKTKRRKDKHRLSESRDTSRDTSSRKKKKR